MTYFAAALVRGSQGWAAAELDLDGADDIDGVVELLREVDTDAAVSLLFVEADDEYLVVLRLDSGDDLRVFASDIGFGDESRLGGILLADLESPVVDVDIDAELESDGDTDSDPAPTLHPVGEVDLLTDLGTSAKELLALCGHEGRLPADVMAELATRAGAGQVLEELREA